MKWQGRQGSDNIEDRRGTGGRKVAAGGGLAIIVLIVGLLMGGDPQKLLSDFTNSGQQTENTTSVAERSSEEKALFDFASVTLADNEKVWSKIFADNGAEYVKPKMVIFDEETESACGMANRNTGPFYCPADEKIYLSLTFFNELTERLGAHGDFSFAYVISHEVAHHIQNLLGTTAEMRKMQERTDEVGANRLSVALELQADFLAGVWAHYNQGVLEDGDIEEALSAASAVGDDKLQKQATGYVQPDAFTHGTSKQRMYWFKKGYTTGDISQGDTFKEVL